MRCSSSCCFSDPLCIGARQGMNFVATMCLSVLPEAYEAYGLFVALLSPLGLGLRSLYLRGFQATMGVLQAVEVSLTQRLPATLLAKITATGGGLAQLCLPWVITLTAAAFPVVSGPHHLLCARSAGVFVEMSVLTIALARRHACGPGTFCWPACSTGW